MQEWKAEYEKSRTAHAQYIKMVDTRLEEHSQTLHTRYQAEMAQLQERIKAFEAAEKTRSSDLLSLQQRNSNKEAELKTAQSALASLQRKTASLETRLRESHATNEALTSDITSLREVKDPSTIVQVYFNLS